MTAPSPGDTLTFTIGKPPTIESLIARAESAERERDALRELVREARYFLLVHGGNSDRTRDMIARIDAALAAIEGA